MPTGTAEGPLLAERYRVIKRLGSGGMAAVYLATDERLDRPVAVKRLHTASHDELDSRRFQREAKLGASLSHPNLVSIFDTEEDEESVLLVMEYVEGETLADLLARGPVEPARAVEIVHAVAAALDHAHANGIVHRDVKPANVLLGKDGSVKLADLGIAKAVERTEITGTGTVLGTPAYMAPEQLEGRKLSSAVDVYALATLAYEMLTGERARRGRTAVEIAHQVVNELPPNARDVNPDIPAEAAAVLRAGMAREPRERPRSARDLAGRLEAAFDRPDTPAATRRIAPAPQRVEPAARRFSPAALLAVAGLVAVALGALVIALASGGGEEPQQQAARGDGEQRSDGRIEPAGGAEEPAAPEEPAPTEEAVSADAPVDIKGVPQPKGKGTLEEAQALQAEGYSALQAGDYKNAVKLSKQSVEAFPPGTTDVQYAYALFNLGQALRLAGKPEQAIPVLEARLQIPNQTATVEEELAAARADAGE